MAKRLRHCWPLLLYLVGLPALCAFGVGVWAWATRSTYWFTWRWF